MTRVEDGDAQSAGGAGQRDGQPRVYLHIGAYKTGTTYLQSVLWASRERLAGRGVLIPGEGPGRQSVAVGDLLGLSLRGTRESRFAGAWDDLAASVRSWSGHTSVVSMERLSLATKRQARRAVRSLRPADAHVVITARDLARSIPASWQEALKADLRWSWEEFVQAVRDPAALAQAPARWFWMRQELLAILDTWETVVPRDHIHLVTLPAPGSAPALLLERFAAVVGVDVADLETEQPRENASLGVAEAEVLRRLNVGLGGRLNQRQYDRAVKAGVIRALADRDSSARMRLPEQDLAWVSERARSTVEALRERGYHVVGDLEDLVPVPPAVPAGRRPDDVSESEVLDAALSALVGVVERYGRTAAERKFPDPAEGRSVKVRVASTGRRTELKAKSAAVEIADRNAAAAGLLKAYLRRGRRLPARHRQPGTE